MLLIDNIIDRSTATLRLKSMFANTDERLWPGEFVNSRVPIETRKNVIAVPTTVIQRGAQGLFAWVVSDNNKAVPRKIELGPVSGDLTVITAGLKEGDRVVTDGQYKLQVDAPVTIVTAQADATPGASAAKPRHPSTPPSSPYLEARPRSFPLLAAISRKCRHFSECRKSVGIARGGWLCQVLNC